MGAFRFVTGLLMLLSALIISDVARAQEQIEPPPQSPLAVGIYLSPPFAMRDGDGFTGMSVELWETLASDLGFESDYREYATLRDLVDAAAAGEIDAVVTNLTITEDRAERIDFTQPWFDAGLRIMVNENSGAGFGDVVAGLREAGYLRAYGWLAFVIFLAAVLVTLFDRHFDKDFPSRWRDGFAEGFYTVMSVATSGKPPARKNLFGWLGRIWQGLWLVCGIAVLAYITSTVTSVMTTLSFTSQINGLADLPGRTVGVFTGSVAEEFARRSGLQSRSFAHVEEAAEALVDGRIEAIVADAPVLEYYAHTNPSQPVAVVGPIFEPDKYGFGLAHRSPLTRPLTVDLLGAHEEGVVEELRTKYFGDER